MVEIAIIMNIKDMRSSGFAWPCNALDRIQIILIISLALCHIAHIMSPKDLPC